MTDQEMKDQWEEEIKQERLEEMRQEAKEDEWYERQMYNDYEYAFEQMDLTMDTTIRELSDACKTLNKYGHEVTIYDLLGEI